ncbi:cupredoxin domain-containing protein [Geodermatophilus obscurus]|uniref:Plastocyanin n=1 Tax=Geodermatophilus obscurus (strain ATCC 25078 / DSM 43160 / JCM 3152 / CCUG 61914 / KCC A-0152 / KCTC 9177 / NBRC 13315 / NRRL B-3577 / G-20) TaxID=526225 RepID=D2SAL5_GEOOG|nr:hypothetical protein [Geodermatophilus obscurus]ADB73944.1 hypothetical protein Gobs_1195 [Geodermatophilus obscurus DSM 43160]
MSKTVIVDIRFDRFPEVTVPPGTYVVWRNLDPHAHSAETRREDPDYFNAGAMLPGHTSSPISFDEPGQFDYLCRFHTDMVGRITVAQGANIGRHAGPVEPLGDDHGHGHGLHHYHGFVTGGRSADRLYMSHTPVLADARHNYQVILQGRFEDPAQGETYEELRRSDYGHGVVQIFHDHMSMPDIGNGTVKLLPDASVSYYPGGQQRTIPGLESGVRIALDQVIHFHQFDTEADHPHELTYLMYGDQADVFIDHLINRAPSFHSVAKLSSAPPGWVGSSGAVEFTVPGRSMRDVPNRLLDRVSIVDNSFHLFWLLPPGFLERQAQDPLIRRGLPPGVPHPHDIRLATGETARIEIERFLHFDIRLLNYGVLIV